MVVSREKLVHRLEKALLGAETKGGSNYTTNVFSFRDGYVHTFKDFIALSVYLGDEFKFLTGAVRAKEFFKLLSKFSSETVKLEVTPTGIEVEADNATAVFSFVEDQVLRQVDGMELDTLVWKPVPEDFRKALSFSLLGVAEYALEGVRVKEHVVVSIDSKRVNYFVMKDAAGDFLLEEQVVEGLLEFQDYVEIAQSPRRVFLKLSDSTIVSGRRKVDTEYPLEKILSLIKQLSPLPEDPKGVLPKSFKDMLERASILATEMYGLMMIKVTFSQECIEAVSERSIGKYREKVTWEVVPTLLKEPLTVFLESSSALYMLSKSREFVLKVQNNLKRLVFVGENYMCFLAAYSEDVK